MKILTIVPSYKPAYIYGGTIVVVALLAEQLAKSGHDVTVYTTTANGKAELDVPHGVPVNVDGVNVIYFERVTGDHTHASPALWKRLRKTVKDFDVVHIHSWWSLLVIGAALICKQKKVKPVISPHGMLSDYILETNNSGKKKWIHRLLGKRLLRNSYLHVSTQLEWNESKTVIPSWQGRIIPNLVQLPDTRYTRRRNDVFSIGFLSRVDPKKGLDILIKALSKVNFDYRLKVAGVGEEEYIASLKELSRECGNEQKIEWVGWKGKDEKFDFFAGLDLFALTSHSENFAVVVIESLFTGTPVLVSDQVGLSDFVARKQLGWVGTTDPDNVTALLNEIYADKARREQIAEIAPGIVEHEFNGSKLASDYIGLYEDIRSDRNIDL